MMKIFDKLFGKKASVNNTSAPKRPEDWKLTISDLMIELNEGKKKHIGQLELDWAREYERSLIPENYRFPHKGDLYESKYDQEVEFLTAWAAPYTGSGKSTLFRGERIWIDAEPGDKKAIGTYAVPVDYKELETRMVSESDRSEEKYSGFYFYINTMSLNENFILVRTRYRGRKIQ